MQFYTRNLFIIREFKTLNNKNVQVEMKGVIDVELTTFASSQSLLNVTETI